MVRIFSRLDEGDNLCKSKRVPMSLKLIDQVKDLHGKAYYMKDNLGDTPLMRAVRLGYPKMAWGFIQCAKQTNRNLCNNKTLDLQEFLGYKNSSGETALHVAASVANFEAVILLLQDVSGRKLISDRNDKGQTPLSLLSSRTYDEYIFEAMESAKAKGEVDPLTSISISIDEKYQGLQVYAEIAMDLNSYPKSHTNETRESLNKLDKGLLELTPEKNTILHLVSEFGDVNYAKDILKKHHSLIKHRNSVGETPIYVASSQGHVDILEILLNHATLDEIEALATRSDKHTALHIAIQNHHVGVVFWLVKAVPQLANRINNSNESPIYLAVEKEYNIILRFLLDECKEKSFDGPNGKTALHAAVLVRNTECIKELLRENIALLKIHDARGWTPLHYAVDRCLLLTTEVLLEADSNIGMQMTTGDGINTSAVHMAASADYPELLGVLLSKCPGCSEIIDAKGRNILHVAIEKRNISQIKFILENESLTRLINQRDSNGNTPIHLLMASELNMKGIIIDDRFNIYVRNNENRTPVDVASSDEKRETLIEAMAMVREGREGRRRFLWEEIPKALKERKESEIKEKEKKKQVFSKIGDNVVLVVTLIATATFAAAFTVPGGFDGNQGSKQGMPVLLKKSAYQAFAVSNALAFTCSCCVLFGHIRLQLDDAGEEEKEGSINIISLQYLLTGIAMVAMAVAFFTGTYVILTPSLGLAIPLCATCLFLMVSMSFFPRRHLGFATAILRKLG